MLHTKRILVKTSRSDVTVNGRHKRLSKDSCFFDKITVYLFDAKVNKEGYIKMTDYDLMCRQLESLSEGVAWDITVLSNAAALIWETLEDINWAGFYLVKDGKLQLGPFQGKPACTVIEVGKGVCGTAIAEDKTQLVKNVHEFPGHIACDSASNSEIVVPVHAGDTLYGVLDIDSPKFERFSEEDREGLEAFVRILESILK